MKEIVSTLTTKGQVTIPKEVRDHLHLKDHDRVAFVLEANGTVRLTVPQYPTVASLVGAAGSLKQPMSWEEMREIAREDRLRAKQDRDQ
jgi:AbrB family looped-hinge helix DNA binding protein